MATAPIFYLTGNKIDIHGRREVDQQQHENFVRENHLKGGFFVSAMNGDNVMSSFYQGAAASIGKSLTSQELEYFNQVIAVHMVDGDGATADERRRLEVEEFEREMAELDRIEAEKKGACQCAVL